MNGLSALIKETPDSSADRASKKATVQPAEPALRSQTSASRTVRNKRLFNQLPGPWCFVGAAGPSRDRTPAAQDSAHLTYI